MTHIVSIPFEDRTVSLRALYCTATYAGHLEGPHISSSNTRRIAGLRRKAEDLFPNHPVALVDPVRTVGAAIHGYSDSSGGPVFRETLPKVASIAAFDSSGIAGQDGCFSSLTIVWFDDVPLEAPIEAPLVDLLSHVDWDTHARSYWP